MFINNLQIVCIRTFISVFSIFRALREEKKYCPIDTFINVVKGKRKGTIILQPFQGDKRYNESIKLLDNISEWMLTKQLKEGQLGSDMQHNGLV